MTISIASAMEAPSGLSYKITIANQTDYDIPYMFNEDKSIDVDKSICRKILTQKLKAGSDANFIMVRRILNSEGPLWNKPSLLLRLKDNDKHPCCIYLHMSNKDRILKVQKREICEFDPKNGASFGTLLPLAFYSRSFDSLMLIINPDEKIQMSATF